MDPHLGERVSGKIIEAFDDSTFRCDISPFGASCILHTDAVIGIKMKPGMALTVMKFNVSWLDSDIHLHASIDAGAIILLHPSRLRGCLHIAEIFGGISGWSNAADYFVATPLAIVEHDLRAAKNCAAIYGAEVLDADTFLKRAFENKLGKCTVVHASADNLKVWMAFGFLNIAVIYSSPPCQPWSGSGKESGLRSTDGQIFLRTTCIAGWTGIYCLLAENVPGFEKHSDFGELVKTAALNGMKLKIQGVFQCQRVLPLCRDRWLGSFILSSFHVPNDAVDAAGCLSFAHESLSCPLPGPSISTAKVQHINMTCEELTHLTIDDDLFRMLNRSDLVPRWLKEKIVWSEQNPVIHARTLSDYSKVSGVMARYGGQHLLDIGHLLHKGLQTVVFWDGARVRLFSPWEFAAALGFRDGLVFEKDIHFAFQLVGNSISVAHAWLAIAKTHVLLGDFSPFKPVGDFCEHVKHFQETALKLPDFNVVADEHFWKLTPKVIDCECEEPAGKKQKTDGEISPTVPYGIDAVNRSTATLHFQPEFEIDFQTPKEDTACQPFCMGGLVSLSHCERYWMIVIHGEKNETVASFVMRALPHARERHFQKFVLNNNIIEWNDNLCAFPMAHVQFFPVEMNISCRIQDGDVLHFWGDVTWTAHTALAFVATSLKCNVDSICLLHKEIPVKPCDYLMEYEIQEYKVGFKAIMPGYVSFGKSDLKIQDRGLVPTLPNLIRFVARHPAKKVTATAIMNKECCYHQIVKSLFPDVCGGIGWSIVVGNEQVHPNDKFVGDSFYIQWDCYKPLQTTLVEKCFFDVPLSWGKYVPDVDSSLELWMKSPFKAKPEIFRVGADISVSHLAASFVSHSQMTTAIMCQVGGSIVDPTILIKELPNHVVLNFKIAPLLGGAKHDLVKTRVKNILEKHGVPTDASAERTSNFLNKASGDFGETIAKMSDEDCWNHLKQEANKAKFRLVNRAEMIASKKDNRSKPPSKTPKHSHLGNKDAEFVATPSNVRIDMMHFWDGDVNVTQIDASRFGPDQTGIAVMNNVEASKYNYPNSISVGALAILVVGKHFRTDDTIFHLPGHTTMGTPVVLKAALRQFGDKPVVYKANVIAIETPKTDSTVLEIQIFRDEITNWKDCSVPLHFLGVHIPALRGSNLLATWSLKTFNRDRKPTPFREADLWHGFVRVGDSILDSVLARSGISGIYITPKGMDKKPDERYAIVVIPSSNHDDALKRVKNCDKSLGLARLKDQYAVRCRKENLNAVRSMILPESAYVDMGSFATDDTLWILKNVPSQVGREDLTKALQLTAWKAKAVRSQGMNRWVVASATNPPASHLCINNTMVVVEPLKRVLDSAPITMVASEFKCDSTIDNDGTMQISTTSRIAEVKAEISDDINMAIDRRMAEAQAKIDSLAQQVISMQENSQKEQEANRMEFQMMKDEQAFARQRLTDIEATVSQSSTAVVSQVQAMMQQMQSNLESSMKQLVTNQMGDETKRPRVDDVKRHDAFSTSS